MHRLWLFGFLTLNCGIHFVLSQEREYIRPCRKSDPDINQCVRLSFNHLTKYLVHGIPEFGVPSIEPLTIPKVQVENGVGSVRVKAQLQNITVRGVSNHTLTNVRTNLKNLKLTLSFKAPRLEATGRYDVSGTVLLFNIRSKGEFWALFDGAVGTVTLQGTEVVQNGKTYMKVDIAYVDFNVDKAKFRIKDYHNRNRVFSEAVNNFLNSNWREILEEMRHTAALTFSKHLKEILNAALLKVPINEWLLDD